MIVDVAALPTGTSAGPLAVARDGTLWFGETDGSGSAELGKVTLSGKLTDVALPAGSAAGASVSGLATDPAGNVWYTLKGPAALGGGSWAKVGRVSPDGTVTEIPLAAAYDQAGAVTVGTDGVVDVALSAAGKVPAVAKVAADGTVTETPLAGATEAKWLTAGQNGAVWFVDGSKVAKRAADGTVTTYPVIDAAGKPVDLSNAQLTSTADGGVWFLAPGSLGRVTPAGAVSSYPAPGGATPTSLHAGGDGNLWFSFPAPKSGQYSDAPGVLLAKISPDGLTTVMPDRVDATGTAVVGMAAGNDASVWLNEGAGKFGRLSLSSVPTITPPSIRPTTSTSPLVATGQPFTGAVVSFVSNRLDNAVVSYTAAVDWGDGHITPATVVPNANGGYDVVGSNTYTSPAGSSMDVRVVVTDSKGASSAIFNRIQIVAPTPVPLVATHPWKNYKTPIKLTGSIPGAPTATPVANAVATPLPVVTPAPTPRPTPTPTVASSPGAPVAAGSPVAPDVATVTTTTTTTTTVKATTPANTTATAAPVTPVVAAKPTVTPTVTTPTAAQPATPTAVPVVAPLVHSRRVHMPVVKVHKPQAHGPRVMGYPTGPHGRTPRAILIARRGRY